MNETSATRHTLQNRFGLTFYATHEPATTTSDRKRLVIIQHGFTGGASEPHIQAIGATYRRHGYDTLTLDCTHSLNDAEGDLTDATITKHLHDLEDAIAWAATQPFYTEPFALAGHSWGGCSILLYAHKNAHKIRHLFPAAAVLNGPLRVEAAEKYTPESYARFKKDGGEYKTTMRDGKTYEGFKSVASTESLFAIDALKAAQDIHIPTLLVVGEKDTTCPPEHQDHLYQVLHGHKELYVIDKVDHAYRPHLEKMLDILDMWLEEGY